MKNMAINTMYIVQPLMFFMVCLQIYTHIHVNKLVDNNSCLFEEQI